MKIALRKIIEGKMTYPSWSTNKVYEIHCKKVTESEIIAYYCLQGPIKRKISRTFPKYLDLSPRFIWVLGFLRGEGANSKGKSNYRRFTLTNSNPELIKICLCELHVQKLIDITNLPKNSFHIIHALDERKATEYWSAKLSVDSYKIKCFDDVKKTSLFGVCHVYIRDVLLRRAIDEISGYVLSL